MVPIATGFLPSWGGEGDLRNPCTITKFRLSLTILLANTPNILLHQQLFHPKILIMYAVFGHLVKILPHKLTEIAKLYALPITVLEETHSTDL